MTKIFRSFQIGSLIAVLLCSSANAGPVSNETEAFLFRLKSAGEQINQIKDEKGAALGDLKQREQIISHSIAQLKRPPLSEAEIKAMQSEVERRKVHSPAMKSRIEDLQQRIALSKITEPAERAAKQAELERAKARLREEIKAIELPFDLKIKEAAKPIQEMSESWATLLALYFKEPNDGQFSGLKKHGIYWQPNNTGGLSWRGGDGEQICKATIWLNTEPAKLTPGRKTVEGKYEVSLQGKGIATKCGYFSIFIQPEKKEWQRNEPVLTELLKALVDMDALAALEPKK